MDEKKDFFYYLFCSPKIPFLLKNDIIAATSVEQQTIIHISILAKESDLYLYLRDSIIIHIIHSKNIHLKLDFIHSENINFYPGLTFIRSGGQLDFTLVFPRLSNSCKHFNLIEKEPQSGFSLEFKNIERNDMNVYHLVKECF